MRRIMALSLLATMIILNPYISRHVAHASSTSNLTGISCSNPAVCYAVGDSGTILATTDGGASWIQQASGTGAYLKGINCVTWAVCYAVGDSGTILATTNGGASWKQQSSNTGNTLLSISCSSAASCTAVGVGGIIRTTVNGGGWWSSQSSGSGADLYGVSCPSTSTCFVVGLYGTILVSTNSGSWWRAQSSGTGQYLHAVSCPYSVSTCTAVGSNGTILSTTNGGTSWSAQRSGTGSYLHGVACLSTSVCVAVGDNGLALSTTDGGSNWGQQSSGTVAALRGASCPSTTCFASGDGGILRSIATSGAPPPSPSPSPTQGPPPSPTPGPVGGNGGVQDYPRLANLQGFSAGSQAATFARYGLVLARFSPKSANVAAAVQALKAKSASTHVLFYLDTLSVDVPGFDGMSIYPGWWLTLAGTTLSAPLDASSTTVYVTNAAIIDASLGSNPDVLVDGESMHVTAVNVAAGALSVQRGYYSTATVHHTGARLAAHASKWAGSWMLNLSTYCPVDPNTGQTWGSYLVQQALADLGAAPWDGVWYDDSNNSIAALAGGRFDANNDNVADGGDGPSGTGWNTGETQLFAQTHALAPSALLIGNGDVYPTSSGRAMEHFPFYNNGWANALSIYLGLAGPAGTASATIINADTNNTGYQSLQSMRFNLGTALMGNGYYYYDGGTQQHGQTWWYDEYDNGAGSSLAAAINWNQTSLTLAPGTGARFKVGDVVRVPVSTYDGNNMGSTDDEQMLVQGVSGDTLSVQRGYNGTMMAWHNTATKVLTNAQIAAGQGWLGQPLGPAVSLSSGGTSQLQNGDFEVTGPAWRAPWGWSVGGSAAASVNQDSNTAGSGSSSARVTVSQAGAAWDAQLSQGGLSVVGGNTYSLSFWAKGSAGQQILATVQQTVSPYSARAKQWYTLTGNWQQYYLTFTASSTEGNLGAVFNLAAAPGTIWLDGVRFSAGDPNLWRRDFTHGTVLLNGTGAAQTVAIGPGFRQIAGTQDRAVNNGATASSFTIPAQDALLLVKTG